MLPFVGPEQTKVEHGLSSGRHSQPAPPSGQMLVGSHGVSPQQKLTQALSDGVGVGVGVVSNPLLLSSLPQAATRSSNSHRDLIWCGSYRRARRENDQRGRPG